MNPIRFCEVLAGLGDTIVLGIDDGEDHPIRVHIETRRLRPDCARCEIPAVVKDRRRVEFVDLLAPIIRGV